MHAWHVCLHICYCVSKHTRPNPQCLLPTNDSCACPLQTLLMLSLVARSVFLFMFCTMNPHWVLYRNCLLILCQQPVPQRLCHPPAYPGTAAGRSARLLPQAGATCWLLLPSGSWPGLLLAHTPSQCTACCLQQQQMAAAGQHNTAQQLSMFSGKRSTGQHRQQQTARPCYLQ